MYILSDDDFFSLGVRSVFRNAGEHLTILPAVSDSIEESMNRLSDGDTLLLAVDMMDIVNKVLHILSRRDIRICLFINNAKGYECFAGYNGIVSRRTPSGLILSAVKRAIKKNALRRITDDLTPNERAVMDNLATGVSVSHVASLLNIAEKTVYNHKKKATQRMGLNKMKAKAMLVYSGVKQLLYSDSFEKSF